MAEPLRILLVHTAGARAQAVSGVLSRAHYTVIGPVKCEEDALAVCGVTPPDLVMVQASLCGSTNLARFIAQLWQRGPILSILMLDDEPIEQLNELLAAQPLALVPARVTDSELLGIVTLAAQQFRTVRQSRDPDDRFFSVAIDMLCFLDFSGYFRRLSPSWERTLGYTREELMAQPFIEFVHPDDRERTLAQNQVVRKGGRAVGFENRYRCKDGSYRWFRWNAAADMQHTMIYSVARDITESRKATEEREGLIVQLQQALAEVKSLQEIIPICSYCRKVRDDDDYWQHVEAYIHEHTGSRFSHGVCPECVETVLKRDFPDLA